MNTRDCSARERWQRIVREQRESGLPVAQFCREQGVGESSLFAWKRRLAREAQAAATPAFVWVHPAPAVGAQGDAASPADGGIELHLGGGRHLLLRRGFDVPTLAAVLDVLDGRTSPTEQR